MSETETATTENATMETPATETATVETAKKPKPAKKKKPAKTAAPKGKGKSAKPAPKGKPAKTEQRGPGRPALYDPALVEKTLRKFQGMQGGLKAAFLELRKIFPNISKGTLSVRAESLGISFLRGSLGTAATEAIAKLANGGRRRKTA